MDKKKLELAQEELRAKLEEIAIEGTNGNPVELAKLANMPIDAELPFPEVVEEICKTASVEKGEDYEYFTLSPETKVVTTITNGSITETAVTPGDPTDLTWTNKTSNRYYVYVEKLMDAKYDPIEIKMKTAMSSLNYFETKTVLDLAIAAAEAQSNTFANDSSDSAIDFEKLVEIVESLVKYGDKIVMVAGATVYKDVILMDYNDNKQREVSPQKAGITKVIPVRTYQYTDSTTQTILADDKAVFVATVDASEERPIHFVRRKRRELAGGLNATKERIAVASGPLITVGGTTKWAYAIAVMEQIGAVVTNQRACAVYKNDTSYS